MDICYATLAKYFKKHPEERERIKVLRKMVTKKDVRHPLRTMSDVGFKNLAFAVVQLAVKDYKAALKAEKKNRRDIKVQLEKESLEEFFFSDRFLMFCDLEPKKIITECYKKVYRKEGVTSWENQRY